MSSNQERIVSVFVLPAAHLDALKIAKNHHDIVKLIFPEMFRVMVTAYLDTYAEIVTKIGNLRDYLVTLNSAILKGPIPPFILGAIKTPSLQFTKEFQHTGERQAAANKLDELTGSYRQKMLEACFQVKSEELEHLYGIAENFASGIALKEEMTKFYTNISKNIVADTAERQGNSIISDELEDIYTSLPQILRRTHEFATLRVMQAKANKIRKREIKKSVDVVMGDASQSDLISLIRSEVGKLTAKPHSNKKIKHTNKSKKPK